jgi:flagellum-specific ATP synthase
MLREYHTRASKNIPFIVEGKVTRMVGLTVEAVGCQAAIGARCLVSSAEGQIEAEVVGFSGDRLLLMPTSDIRGLVPNARVIPGQRMYEGSVGDGLLGRVIDAAGKPLDGKGALRCNTSMPLAGRPANPLARWSIDEPLDVGVASINALLAAVLARVCCSA